MKAEDRETGYDHSFETERGEVELGVHRHENNAFVRWRVGERSGEFGALYDGRVVLNFREFAMGKEEADSVELPDEVLDLLRSEVGRIRREIMASMTDAEVRKQEEDRRVFDRARDILAESDVPGPSEYERHLISPEDYDGEIEVGVDSHNGVAEIYVSSEATDGFVPTYDLSKNRITLPPNDWGVTREVEVPERVALGLLGDLRSLQQELIERRKAYDEAVQQAEEEVLDET